MLVKKTKKKKMNNLVHLTSQCTHWTARPRLVVGVETLEMVQDRTKMRRMGVVIV